MNCEQVQAELSVAEYRAFGQERRIGRHLQECPACRDFAAATKEIETAVQEWRSEEPPTVLQTRISESLALQTTPARALPSRLPRPALLPRFAAAAAALVGIVLLLSGRGDTAEAAIKKMASAVSHVRNAHVVTWVSEYTTNDGIAHKFPALQKSEELWYQDGCWRKEGVWGSRLIVKKPTSIIGAQGRKIATFGMYYRYDAKTKRVIALHETGAQWSHFTMEEVTGDDLTSDRCKVTTLGISQERGQTLHEIMVQRKEGASGAVTETGPRELCWLDTATGLPVRIMYQNYQGAQWVTTSRYEFQFNQKMPPALFDPKTLHQEGWSPR